MTDDMNRPESEAAESKDIAFESIRQKNRSSFGDLIYTGRTSGDSSSENRKTSAYERRETVEGRISSYDREEVLDDGSSSYEKRQYSGRRGSTSSRRGRAGSRRQDSEIRIVAGQNRRRKKQDSDDTGSPDRTPDQRQASDRNRNQGRDKERRKSRPHRRQLSETELYLRKKRRQKIRKFILTMGVFLILLAAVASIRITNVTVEGNTRYTAEEIREYILGSGLSDNPIVFLLKDKFGEKTEIPYVDKYTVRLTGPTSADIIIYEKEIIGYMQIMGDYIYLDEDGYIIEISKEIPEGVPLITGLQSDSAVLGEKLTGVHDRVFTEIQDISVFMKNTTISWNGAEVALYSLFQSFDFDSFDNVTCNFGDIKVDLGSNDDMEAKLLEMKDIMPQLCGKTGTLRLDTYNENVPGSSFALTTE